MSETIRVSAADGYALGATLFRAGAPGPVVVVNGALGVSQRYYGKFAGYLAERGSPALTYDYRGLGESRPYRLRGFEARTRDWGEQDFEGVLRFVAHEFPGRAVVAVGHSMGGQILGLAQSNTRLSGAVTVAAQSGYWRHWPRPTRYAMAALWWGLIPAVANTVGFLPGRLGIGEDVPAGVALEWARWGRKPGYLTDDGIAADGFARLGIPVLAYSFADDVYAPRRSVDALHAWFTRAAVDRQHLRPKDEGLPGVGHFGFFREKFRDTLWKRAAEFLEGTQARQAA